MKKRKRIREIRFFSKLHSSRCWRGEGTGKGMSEATLATLSYNRGKRVLERRLPEAARQNAAGNQPVYLLMRKEGSENFFYLERRRCPSQD